MERNRLPQGMRDLFPEECSTKETLKKTILNVFRGYGYRQIETPLIEYYATYQNAYSSLEDGKMYKLLDGNGYTTALRSDMTLPIARLCATKLATVKPPYRFCYCGEVYQINEAFGGKRNAVTDCGIELIGLKEESDLEVLSCALDAMEAVLPGRYILEIGTSAIFRKACEEAGLDEEEERILADLIERKALPDIEAFVKNPKLSESAALFFKQLALLSGTDVFEKALSLAFTDSLKEEVERLSNLSKELSALGYGDVLRFDLGKVAQLDYYTGIIFQAYAKGVGSAVLSGGRYDDLLSKLGRELPAVGFGIRLDYLLEVTVKNELQIEKLYYREGSLKEALLQAKQMRKKGPVELVPLEEGEE